jgi:hypothetical protein
MEHTLRLGSLSDDEILRRLSELLRQSRRVEADLVAHIAEVDARRLYAREAASSMFVYCTEALHLSEPEAYLRITVARASRSYPVLLTMLRDGGLHLSGIALLVPHMTEENHGTLLQRAAHRSKREIQEMVAALAPRPDARPGMRKLPDRRGPAASAAPLALPLDREGPSAVGPGSDDVPRGSSVPHLDEPLLRDAQLRPDRVSTPSGARAKRLLAVEPLAPARYKVQFTASAELHDKLKRLQALMRSSVPDGDMAAIIEAAVTEKLERLEAKRFARTKAPRKSLPETNTAPSSRHVPAAVRRAVYERDGGRCTYKDRRGRRCQARDRLEFHHHDRPFGRGGEHNPANVRVMCKTHNLLLAERDYGREKMAQYRRSVSRLSEQPAASAVDHQVVGGSSTHSP